MGSGAGLDRWGKSRLHRDSIPGPSSPWRVAIPTELSGPMWSGITGVSVKVPTSAGTATFCTTTVQFVLLQLHHSADIVMRSGLTACAQLDRQLFGMRCLSTQSELSLMMAVVAAPKHVSVYFEFIRTF